MAQPRKFQTLVFYHKVNSWRVRTQVQARWGLLAQNSYQVSSNHWCITVQTQRLRACRPIISVIRHCQLYLLSSICKCHHHKQLKMDTPIHLSTNPGRVVSQCQNCSSSLNPFHSTILLLIKDSSRIMEMLWCLHSRSHGFLYFSQYTLAKCLHSLQKSSLKCNLLTHLPRRKRK